MDSQLVRKKSENLWGKKQQFADRVMVDMER